MQIIRNLIFILAAISVVQAQSNHEVLHLTNGTVVSGDVLSIDNNQVVLARKIGEGSMKQNIKFDKISANSLYALLVHRLAPLDAEKHVLIGETAMAAGLYQVATRHFRTAGKLGGGITELLSGFIDNCIEKDSENLMSRSRKALSQEHFSQARKLALLLMRRYPNRTIAMGIPGHLDDIGKLREAAQKRQEALSRSRRDRVAWQMGERALARTSAWIVKARKAETNGLRSSSQFRVARTEFENGIRHLRNAENDTARIRKTRALPPGLRGELVKLEESVVAMHIRIRLHLASLYSVRGSYASALSTVNAALAYDPTNEQATAARGRIEQSAAAASVRRVSNR